MIAGRRSLAPSFDHASCLGFQLDDEQRERRLQTRDENFTPEAYADRARTPFEGRPHPMAAAMRAMSMSATVASNFWIDRCRNVESLIESVWMVPEDRMSQLARRFAERVLRRNCYRLLSQGN